MNENQLKFLTAILGDDGAKALEKSIERTPILGNALVPRAILAWIKNIESFNGAIPGLDNKIEFKKNESGWTGEIDINSHLHKFENVSVLNVVSAISMAIGFNGEYTAEGIRNLDLNKLGKSLDVLVKSKEVIKKSKKKTEDEDLEKIEAPGKTAAPIAPAAPIATDQAPAIKPAEKPAVAKMPKAPKQGATVSLTRSEMDHPCSMCGNTQFKDNEFIGCTCFSSLKKSVDILHLDDLGCVVHVSEDLATIATLMESMGRE